MTLVPQTEAKPREFLSTPAFGVDHKCELLDVPLKLLKLDLDNPRLGHIQHSMNEEEIENTIWAEPKTKKLKIAIELNCLQTPLFVQRTVDGGFRVREGARRTTCLRHIVRDIEKGKKKEKGLKLEKFSSVPVYVYPDNMSESHVAMHLAGEHVAGKDPWDALNRARQIYRLNDELDVSYEDIAENLGISKTTIKQSIWAFNQALSFHEKYPEYDEWIHRYSHFQKLYSKKELRETWVKDPKNMDLFRSWINEGKIPYAFKITSLDKIIADGPLFKWFKESNHTLDEAIDRLKGKKTERQITDTISNKVDDAVQTLLDNIPLLSLNKLQKIAGSNELKKLEEIQMLLDQTINNIKAIKP